MKKLLIGAGIASVLLLGACSKSYLDKKPLGSAGFTTLANAAGVNQLLIGAYSLLDGEADQSGYNFGSGAEDWVYGDVVGGNSYKGSTPSDQGDILPLEIFSANSANSYPNQKWVALYEGIARVNQTIQAANAATDLKDADKAEILAECKFLRAFYHFSAVKLWGKVPYIDETVTNFYIPNTASIYPKIEADLTAAIAVLPATQSQVGRPSKGAAQAMLGKVYVFEKNYTAALPLLNAVITNPLYGLMPNFADNFNLDKKNNKEEIFQVQYAVNDGSNQPGSNGNYGDVLNYPNGGGAPAGCCGFNQPTQNLVNAFQTDANGLPLFDTYATTLFKNDQGKLSTDAFQPDSVTNLDPRLDWTVGRRGIPYLDWGNFPGASWIRDQATAGPYAPKKNIFRKSQASSGAATSGWTNAVNANNYSVIRYADVLLLAAECEVEVGSLANALTYVNQVRARAAASPVYKTDASGADTKVPAAHYVVGQYLSFPSQDYARKAVLFERRLELAMEGHWFFDLVRTGNAPAFFATYFANPFPAASPLAGASFKTGKNELYAIPQAQIDLSVSGGKPTLIQNPGY